MGDLYKSRVLLYQVSSTVAELWLCRPVESLSNPSFLLSRSEAILDLIPTISFRQASKTHLVPPTTHHLPLSTSVLLFHSYIKSESTFSSG